MPETPTSLEAKPLRDYMDDDYHRSTSPDDMRSYADGCKDNNSNNGMCPCCGVEVEVQKILEGIGQQQVCPSCGWMSDYIYDE